MKQLKIALFFLISFVQGLINAQVFYPQFINGLLSGERAKEAYTKIDIPFLINNLAAKFEATYFIINKDIIYFLPFILLSTLILAGHSLVKKGKRIINMKEIYLVFISLILSFFLIYISPYNVIRYLSGVIPLLIVLKIIFIRLIPSKNFRYLVVAALFIVYITQSLNVSNVHYVYKGDQDKLIFNNMPSAPVYFFNSSRWWHGIVSSNFTAEQKYKVVLDEKPVIDFSETGVQKIFLIIDGYPKYKVLKKQIENDKWIIKEEIDYRSFIIIRIEKVKLDSCCKNSEKPSTV